MTTTPRDEAKLRHIVENARIHPGDSVLDAGTGAGALLPYLADAVGRFGAIDALDLSGEMLSQAHTSHSKLPLPVRFFLADVENDTLHTLYDRIILLDVLPHLDHPLETIERLFRRNLSGGGTLTLAHSTGRETLNRHNAENGNEAHVVPPATELATRLADLGLRVDFVEDTDSCWTIRLRRH